MKFDDKMLLVAKIAFFVYIVLSPFINHAPISFLNTLVAKILLLAIIVGASFADLQLAIVMTLAFLILIINLNKEAIFGIKNTPGSQMPSMSEHFSVGLPREALAPDSKKFEPPTSNNVTTFPDQCDSFKEDREKISKDLYDLYIDPKIKPYEMYIKALSNPESVENAGESAVLGYI